MTLIEEMILDELERLYEIYNSELLDLSTKRHECFEEIRKRKLKELHEYY